MSKKPAPTVCIVCGQPKAIHTESELNTGCRRDVESATSEET